jgi:hypothetical protein
VSDSPLLRSLWSFHRISKITRWFDKARSQCFQARLLYHKLSLKLGIQPYATRKLVHIITIMGTLQADRRMLVMNVPALRSASSLDRHPVVPIGWFRGWPSRLVWLSPHWDPLSGLAANSNNHMSHLQPSQSNSQRKGRKTATMHHQSYKHCSIDLTFSWMPGVSIPIMSHITQIKASKLAQT